MSEKTRRRYSEEFKVDAVKLVEEQGYSIAEASRRLGIDRSVLARWRREASGNPQRRITHGGGEDERDAELRRLREEVRKLRIEKDILKKAAAFFAKESN